MKDNLIAEVKFTKFRNKVKVELPFGMTCTHSGNALPNSFTLDASDGLIQSWLGNVHAAFNKAKSIKRKVNLNLAYDRCDLPGIRK